MSEEHESWSRTQFVKLKQFGEIVITLILDAGLILSVWALWKLVIAIVGVDPNTIQDREVYWVVRLSEFGTITTLAVYVVSDIIRVFLKVYKDIKHDFLRLVFTKSVQTQRDI